MKTEGNHRRPAIRMRAIVSRFQFLLQWPKGRIHLRCRDVCLARTMKAELADRKPSRGIVMIVADRRPERPAKHGPVRVQVARLRRRIEHRTGVRMRPLLKQLHRVRVAVQHTRYQIARIKRLKLLPSRRNPRPHPLPKIDGSRRKPVTKPFAIQPGDLKNPMTARRTARMTDQPRS